jgi:hypothetical protein
MFSYCAYGLNICSDLPLPELLCHDLSTAPVPDAFVRLGKVKLRPREERPRGGCFHVTPDEAYFFWEEFGTYLVRGGREIIVEPAVRAREGTPRQVILGVALGVLLHQRGLLTLHASAVAVDGGAVAFAGGKRMGKSTRAAALHARGYPIVADDVVAVSLSNTEEPMVLPGFPHLKLWPDAAAILGDGPGDWAGVHPAVEKRTRPALRGFSKGALPLRCIYILTDGTHQGVEPLYSQGIFLELVRHSYALRFVGSVGASVEHFRQSVRLAKAVPFYYLNRPLALPEMLDLAHLVEANTAAPALTR